MDWKAKRLSVGQGIWQVSRSDVRVVGVKSHRSERPIWLVEVFTDDRGRPLDQYRLRRSFYGLCERRRCPR